MKVFRGFDNLPEFVRPVVTVGSYDGVHAGHRKLLQSIVALARAQDVQSVVITFHPHPRRVLGNRGEPVGLLNTLDEKTLLLDSLGIDNLIVLPFTREVSRISSYGFVRDYLVDKLGAGTVVVGYDHHFGYNHEGDFSYLRSLQAEFGFDIYEITEHEEHEHKVSSTVIRRMIRQGRMTDAAGLLAFPYFMIVREGRVAECDKLLPPPGRYPVGIYLSGSLPGPPTFMHRDRLEITAKGELIFEHGPDYPGDLIVVFC